jgi:hypothetical protein
LKGYTTTEWQTLTATTSCTESVTVYSTFSSCLVGTDTVVGTRTSSCVRTVSPIVGCDVTGGATRTFSTISKSGGCTLAPLIWAEDEGDNYGIPNNISAMATGIPIPYLEMMPNATGGSCPWTPIDIEDGEGDNFPNDTIAIPTLTMKNESSAGSCPWAPIDIDDAEGDNFAANSDISIPFLPMKTETISIPELSMKPTSARRVPPTLAHQTVTRKPKAPTLSQTAHPTPPPTTASASSTAVPGPKPIPAGGKWDMVISHAKSLKDNKAHFHWTLYDPAGNEAGGGDAGTPIQCFGRPWKDCFPFDIKYSVNEKDVHSRVDFEIVLDLPSGRRLKFNDKHDSANLPEDGYPSESYGCKDDSRNKANQGVSRTFWCSFEWLGPGGWDGYSDHVG